jgi:hypothetical protein
MWATLPVRAAGNYTAETRLGRAYGAKTEMVFDSCHTLADECPGLVRRVRSVRS